MSLSRRNFITLAGLSFTSIITANSLKNYYLRVANGKPIHTNKFGQLIPDPNRILDLPKGWEYKVISHGGKSLDDGNIVPPAFDGMAAFPGNNKQIILVRNHELSPSSNY